MSVVEVEVVNDLAGVGVFAKFCATECGKYLFCIFMVDVVC